MPALRHLPRLLLAALAASATAGAAFGCGPNSGEFWICINPATGKEDPSIFDRNNYVNGVADPCHCEDPGGPAPQCPLAFDAGPDAH